MFVSYEALATFGVSTIISFSVSIAILLTVAAKRGYFRVGKPRGGQVLLPPADQPRPTAPELTPLASTKLQHS